MNNRAWPFLCASILAAGLPAFGQVPDPAGVQIKTIKFGGSSCKKNNTTITLSPDRRAFTLVYDAFVVTTGPGVPSGAAKGNCQTHITLQVPDGFTFAVNAVDNRGFANLASGARGLFKVVYHFPGPEPNVPTWRTILDSDDWRFRDEVDLGSQSWAPCRGSRNLHIHTRLQVEKGGSTDESFVTMDSVDSEISQRFHLSWKRCS